LRKGQTLSSWYVTLTGILKFGVSRHCSSETAFTEKDTVGEDALEFKPERWISPLPDAVGDAALPGVYFQLLPFGGGFKACM
jgi:hypothetical protein